MKHPLEVLPERLAKAVHDGPPWFVIGGQAVRCLCPYRPSQDVDFGVFNARDANELALLLSRRGKVEVIERGHDTIHLSFDGIDVSIFVLPNLAAHVEGQVLSLDGLLATKVHALLDRGTRRDFFDLYVLLELHQLGLLDSLAALERVYAREVSRGLALRALSYFDDADHEAPLPGEGPGDWQVVKDFFTRGVAALVVPPTCSLAIQTQVVEVRSAPRAGKAPSRRKQPAPAAKPRRSKSRSGKPESATTSKRSRRGSRRK